MVCNKIFSDNSLREFSLNPYSTGIWSATSTAKTVDALMKRLNPYSTGIWSATTTEERAAKREAGLNPYSTGIWSATNSKAYQ